jgi:hypothetical protein
MNVRKLAIPFARVLPISLSALSYPVDIITTKSSRAKNARCENLSFPVSGQMKLGGMAW